MGKKGSKGPKVRANTRPKVDEKPNLFERMFNRKKFDVLGKKSKGQQRKIGQARSDAVERRKKTLLVEYKQLKKSNVFLDRRFGEDDATMMEEDRAVARFQKQRMKELAGNKFTLADEDGEGELLTHMGRSLADVDFKGGPGQGLGSDDDEGEDELPAEIVRDHHFGGFVRKADGSGGEGLGDDTVAPRKTKKEVMEEIIAKSKAGKAEKRMAREEDLDETMALDEQLKEVMAGGGLAALMRPSGRKGGGPAGAAGVPEDDAAFDRIRRELVHDRRGTVGDRLKSAEEVAAEEERRAEAAEKLRRKRARGAESDEEGDEGVDAGAASGGFAARRRRVEQREKVSRVPHGPSGDAMEDDFEGGSEGESGSDSEGDGGDGDDGDAVTGRDGRLTLQQRQAARAAGDHPLQRSLRAAAAQLAAKYGVAVPRRDAGSDDEGDDEDGDLEEGGDSSGSDEEEGEESEEGSEVSGEEDGEDAEEVGDVRGQLPLRGKLHADVASEGADEDSASASEEAADEDSESSEEAASDDNVGGVASARAGKGGGGGAGPAQIRGGLPKQEKGGSGTVHVTRVESYAEFAAAVEGKPAEKLGEAVAGLRAALVGAPADEKRCRTQVLYTILVQHFALRADVVPLPVAELDVLTPHLCALTPDVPFYAARVARERLLKMQQRLTSALRNPSSNPGSNPNGAWPATRHVMLLRLWALLFPVSDRRHPVVTPAVLLLGSYLALCPVTHPRHIALGLFLSSLGMQIAAPEKRYMPEPLGFAVKVLRSALPADHPAAADPNLRGTSAAAPGPRWLLPEGGWAAFSAAKPSARVKPLAFNSVVNMPADDPYFTGNAFRLSALGAAIGTVASAADVFRNAAALPEILAPARGVLDALGSVGGLPKALEESRVSVCAELAGVSEACIARRRPLTRKARVAAPEVKQYNPRFEEDFALGKDYDPDRQRVEERKLKRQVAKERRSAMRELRKDAAFLGQQRGAERDAANAERRATLRRGLALLERQEADFKSGGQGGMWKKRKGKK